MLEEQWKWIPLKVHPKIPASAVVEESDRFMPHNEFVCKSRRQSFEEHGNEDCYKFIPPKVLSPSGLEKDVFEAMESMDILLEFDNRGYHTLCDRKLVLAPYEYLAPVWVLAHFFTHAKGCIYAHCAETSSNARREKSIAYISHPIPEALLSGVDPHKEYQLVIPVNDYPLNSFEGTTGVELKNHPQTLEAVFLNSVDWFLNEFLTVTEKNHEFTFDASNVDVTNRCPLLQPFYFGEVAGLDYIWITDRPSISDQGVSRAYQRIMRLESPAAKK